MKGEKIIIFCFLAIFLMTASGLVNAINLSENKEDEKISTTENLDWYNYQDSFSYALGGRWVKCNCQENFMEQRCGFIQVYNHKGNGNKVYGCAYDANIIDTDDNYNYCEGLKYYDPSLGHELKELRVQIDLETQENRLAEYVWARVQLIADGQIVPGGKIIDREITNYEGGPISISTTSNYVVPQGYRQKQTYGFQVDLGTGTSDGTWTVIDNIFANFIIDYKNTAIITKVSAPYSHTTKGGRQQAKIDITGFTTTGSTVKYYAENLQTGEIFLPINPDWDENEFYNFGKGIIEVKYDNKHDDIKVVAVSTTDPSKEDYEIVDMPWEKSLNNNFFKICSFPILENLLKLLQNKINL